jgi:hypothetical protein
MELFLGRKILLLVLAICIAFTVIFTEILIATDHDHNHDLIEEDCPICRQIEAANILLVALKLASLFVFFIAFLTIHDKFLPQYTQYFSIAISSFSLKVRFNS